MSDGSLWVEGRATFIDFVVIEKCQQIRAMSESAVRFVFFKTRAAAAPKSKHRPGDGEGGSNSSGFGVCPNFAAPPRKLITLLP